MTPLLGDAPGASPFTAEPENDSAGSERHLALLVTEEEADALMTVLLLAPLEGGSMGEAMERLLGRLADVQRAFGRDERG